MCLSEGGGLRPPGACNQVAGNRQLEHAVDDIVRRLYESQFGAARIADRDVVAQLLMEAAAATGNTRFTARMLMPEWEQVVDAWQLASWDAWRDAARLGRKTRLPPKPALFMNPLLRPPIWPVIRHVLAPRARLLSSTLARMLSSRPPPRPRDVRS